MQRANEYDDERNDRFNDLVWWNDQNEILFFPFFFRFYKKTWNRSKFIRIRFVFSQMPKKQLFIFVTVQVNGSVSRVTKTNEDIAHF